MRDLLVVLPAVLGSLYGIKQPWIGILVWTWLSLMSPNRLTYGFAYSAPLAAIAAGCTLLGLMLTRDRSSPFKGAPVVWLALFMLWMTLSRYLGTGPERDYESWSKVMKIDGFMLVALAVMHSKKHIMALAWVATMSLALLGAKGGAFVIATAGGHKVFGPPESFISDNNHFATALAMTVPLLRFLQLQLPEAACWQRRGVGLVMLLTAIAALGSYSRGALLSLTGMALMMWWRSKKRLVGGVVLLLLPVLLVSVMPDAWMERMNSIKDHDQDASAQGRFNAWIMAWNAAPHHLFGLGFVTWTPEHFAIYAPHPEDVHAAHSIYFQVLGSHGYIGLALFLVLWFSTCRMAGWLRKNAAHIEQARWAAELGTYVQVSFIAYLVGGSFLSLAYFDLPYNLTVLVVLARQWVLTKGWEREPVSPPEKGAKPGKDAKPGKRRAQGRAGRF
ncbi:putative O-glycosylation ligase, exosortase A system-associated [Azohydromonas australica]|uniref:putative O-glycosylation ligase, exosortase A system-associated n=1 Tax=Azohydromonas australica TaxID=364039 RepID=UPI0003FDD9BD|nr:putative O-glycosylation ligase, exosortase A system-associated [Azohydromonas australica]